MQMAFFFIFSLKSTWYIRHSPSVHDTATQEAGGTERPVLCVSVTVHRITISWFYNTCWVKDTWRMLFYLLYLVSKYIYLAEQAAEQGWYLGGCPVRALGVRFRCRSPSKCFDNPSHTSIRRNKIQQCHLYTTKTTDMDKTILELGLRTKHVGLWDKASLYFKRQCQYQYFW